MDYIFVHIPKTAGTSFRLSAKESFSCLWDYGPESPITSDVIKRTIYANNVDGLAKPDATAGYEFLAGHFPAFKYRHIFPKAKFITFVRDPIERFVSEYNHYVREERFLGSIEEFCEVPIHFNQQFRCFERVSLDGFFFVGITEQYSKSLARFNKMSQKKLKERQINLATDYSRHPSEILNVNELTQSALEKIRRVNAEDIEIYSRAVERFS